jgi:ribosomal 50S subunit-associated protein YjgA (DUF615 family)
MTVQKIKELLQKIDNEAIVEIINKNSESFKIEDIFSHKMENEKGEIVEKAFIYCK